MCSRALDNNCEISRNISRYVYGKVLQVYIYRRVGVDYKNWITITIRARLLIGDYDFDYMLKYLIMIMSMITTS